MSRTVHHRKPGSPRAPRKRPIPEGRTLATFRRGDFDALEPFESSASRRTRVPR